jgi:uncharacterized iron-regulated protein
MGEEHNHPMHHRAEYRMLKALREHTPAHVPLALGLEMFEGTKDHSAALNDFVFGSDDLHDLKRRTNWNQTWGWPIWHWAKILNYAKSNQIRVVGMNAPAKVSDFIERNGIHGLLGRPRFPDVDLSDSVHLEQFVTEKPSSAAVLARSELEMAHAYEAQTLREEWMAQSLASHSRKHGGRILSIMGRNHVAGRRGVPNRIHRRLQPLDWVAPFTILLQGAEWHPKDSALPKCADLPGTEKADWLWYVEHKKGCTLN